MTRPGGRAEQLNSRLLQRTGDEEVLHHPRGPAAERARGPRAAIAPIRSPGAAIFVSERDVDDMAVRVVVRERRRRSRAGSNARSRTGSSSIRNASPAARHRSEHVRPPLRQPAPRHAGSRRSGWEVDEPGAGGGQRVGEQVGADPVTRRSGPAPAQGRPPGPRSARRGRSATRRRPHTGSASPRRQAVRGRLAAADDDHVLGPCGRPPSHAACNARQRREPS